MSKLIYVDRLKKDILNLPDCYNGFSDTYDKACIIGVIDEQPTIESRKKGKWEHTGVTKSYRFTCSACGQTAYYVSGSCSSTRIQNVCKYNFCPSCGADMRGGEE